MKLSKSKRLEFYQSLASMLASGVSPLLALNTYATGLGNNRLSKALISLAQKLQTSGSFAEALGQTLTGLNPYECPIIAAYEQVGRLDQGLQLVAGNLFDEEQFLQKIIDDVKGPIISVHFGALVLPAIELIQDNLSFFGYLVRVAGVLGIIYATIFIVYHLFQTIQGKNQVLGQAVLAVPFLGQLLAWIDFKRYLAPYLAFLKAGLPRKDIHDNAVRAISMPLTRLAANRLFTILSSPDKAGEVWPKTFYKFLSAESLLGWQTSIYAGTEEANLSKLNEQYAIKIDRLLHEVAKWGGKIIQLGVMLVLAYSIYHFHMGRLDVLNQIDQW